MSLADLHRALAVTVAVVAVATAIAAGAGSRLGRGRLALDRLILAGLAVVSVSYATGALMLVLGTTPGDPLHFVYAVAAAVALPVARLWPGFERRRTLVVVGAGIVTVLLVVRLFQTG